MDRVFADTGYWIALLDSRDELHQRATTISRDFSLNRIVTTEMVLTEFLNSFSGPRVREAAARAVEYLRRSEAVILPQTHRLFESALQRYRAVPDKNWSLTDCASFVVMQEERLTDALTHDRHFSQAGFQILLR